MASKKKKNPIEKLLPVDEEANSAVGKALVKSHGGATPIKKDGRWISLLKTGEGCVCSLDIEIYSVPTGLFGSTIKVQVNSSSGSFKTTLLETREIVSPSRTAAELQSLRKALEMCVDYMGR